MTPPSAATLKDTSVVLSATSTSKLSEDYTSSLNILLDLTSSNPIGVFQDYQGDTEAVAIRSDKQLIHIYRDGQKSGASWNIVEIGGTIQVSEVVTGQDSSGTVQAFFRDDDNLYQISFNQDGTWTTPTTLPLCSSLQSTTNTNTGDLIISGVTKEGDLQFVQQQSDSTWEATTIDFNKALLGTAPYLVIPVSITGQMNWALGVVLNNTFNVYTGIGTQKASGPDPIQAPAAANQVLLGYYNSQSYMFMFSDTNQALYTSVNTTDNLQTIPNTKTVRGAGLINNDNQLLQVYSIDSNGNLWVLHQTGWDINTGAPIWAPNIPLDVGLVQVRINGLPQDAPNLFGLSDDGTLHFVAKDPNSGIWTKAVVQQPMSDDQACKQQPYKVTTYRTQINIIDQFKNPQRNLSVTLSAQTEIAVWVEGQTYHLNASQSATVQTNSLGVLTVVTPARGLHTPEITVTAENLTPFTFQPDGEIHSYLAGSGPINNLPTLDSQGTTLQNATVDGAPLAPNVGDNAGAAAQGIQNAMKTQPGQNGQLSLLEAEGVVGWALDLRDRKNPKFTRFYTHEDMEAYKQGAFAGVSQTLLGDWWDDVKGFFGDVWNGIKSAAIAVEHWVVDAVNKVVSFIAKVGEELVQLANLVIQGIEEVISIVQSIFAAIAAFVEKVIKWLEAFFSWGDMIDTKNAMISALNQYGGYLKTFIGNERDRVENGFFANAKTAVKGYFGQLIQQYEGQNMQSLVSTAQATRLEAGAHPLLALSDGTPLQPNDFSGNVHNNWLLDKLLNAFSGAPDFQAVPDLTKPLQDLSTAINQSMSDFEAAMNSIWDGFKTLFTDPKDFASVGIADFLQGVQDLVLAALDFADGIITALLDTIVAVSDFVSNLLTIPLEIPLITPLLNLIGIPNVSIADVFCLLAAIPLTLVYKLIHGADAKLFPGGVLPTSVSTSDVGDGDTKQAMVFVSVGLMAVWALMDTCLDAFNESPIFFLSVLDLIFPTLIQIFTWPTDSQIPFSPIPLDTPGEQANCANWSVGWAVIALNLALLLAPNIPFSEGTSKTVARYIDPVGIGLLAFLGCLNMAAGIASIVENKPDGATIAATILSPIPNLAQPLRLEVVRDASEEVSLVVKLALDFFTGEGCAVATAVG